MNLIEFKETILAMFQERKIKMSKKKVIREMETDAFVLDVVDKTVIWFVENYKKNETE